MNVESKIRKETMTNRYGDEFVFTLLEDGNIQWDGKFEYVRVGFPNDYTESYKAYTNLGGLMGFKEFKEEVHRSIYDENDKYVGPCDIARVYGKLVKSKKDVINMVDPSGGPYLTEGMEIMGKTIKEFKSNENGYLIITK
jgi:hypothetical protein